MSRETQKRLRENEQLEAAASPGAYERRLREGFQRLSRKNPGNYSYNLPRSGSYATDKDLLNLMPLEFRESPKALALVKKWIRDRDDAERASRNLPDFMM